MLLLSQVDWPELLKTAGPMGVIFILAVLGVVAGARVVKGLILGAIEDARKERDYMRQQTERQATAFIQSLEKQGEMMKEGFDEVLREVRSRRK